MEMKEQTRNTYVEQEIKKNGRSGTFTPIIDIPINTAEWFKHIRKQIESKIDIEKYEDDDILAEATISQVSYTNVETGECDVRWEVRYEIVV